VLQQAAEHHALAAAAAAAEAGRLAALLDPTVREAMTETVVLPAQVRVPIFPALARKATETRNSLMRLAEMTGILDSLMCHC
jgi:hypothetical protein